MKKHSPSSLKPKKQQHIEYDSIQKQKAPFDPKLPLPETLKSRTVWKTDIKNKLWIFDWIIQKIFGK